ncbi:DUF3168 domain-containing protein [Mesorhizobium sp. M0933]|uniref:tail completion protein gp17 n=1 Tax=Mesorhizobium sp. M0933 TaxID=2957030 RepID=UPI0033398DE3
MSALTIVRDILLADTTVIAVTATRIWPIVKPQNSPNPAIVLTLVSEEDGRHLGGSNRYPLARYIVDCLADDYAGADALGDKVKDALRDYRGVAGGITVDDLALDDLDFFDRGEQGDIWRRRLGFRIRYRA